MSPTGWPADEYPACLDTEDHPLGGMAKGRTLSGPAPLGTSTDHDAATETVAPARDSDATCIVAGRSVAETGDSETSQLAKLPRLTSGVTLRRRHRVLNPRRFATVERATGRWWDNGGRAGTCAPAADLAHLLRQIDGAAWLILCDDNARQVVSGWGSEQAPEGWRVTSSFLDDRAPCFDVAHDASGRRVRVSVGSQWTGRVMGGERTGQVVAYVRQAIEWTWRRERGTLLVTPATTGRDLLARSLGDDVELPTLSDDVAELIRENSGQHRLELFGAGRDVPAFVEVDARLAYAAVTWQLPVGEPEWRRGEPADPASRWRGLCRWSAPAGWNGPGLLPLRSADGWTWPAAGAGTSWLDGSEAHLARLHGWRVDVVEHIAWPKGPDPLRTWTSRLRNLYADTWPAEAAGDLHPETGQGVRAAVRAILLHGIGALQGRLQLVTHHLPVERMAEIPADAVGYTLSADESQVVWSEYAPNPWPEMVRPEWTACIWARTRCRTMDAPGAKARGAAPGPAPRVGALHLPAGVDLIGIRGDALYLTGDPGWPDDGQPGRFRVKEHRGPMTVPSTLAELDALRRAGTADPYPSGAARARAALAEAQRRMSARG